MPSYVKPKLGVMDLKAIACHPYVPMWQSLAGIVKAGLKDTNVNSISYSQYVDVVKVFRRFFEPVGE